MSTIFFSYLIAILKMFNKTFIVKLYSSFVKYGTQDDINVVYDVLF